MAAMDLAGEERLDRPPDSVTSSEECPIGPRRVESVLIAGVVLLVVLLSWHQRWTSDDAFINFRIVENILNGDGPVYNVGIRVESGTSPLWLLFLAVFSLIPGLGVEWTAVFLGIGLTGAGFLLAGLGGRRLLAGRAPVVLPFGMLMTACLPAMWDFASSGLETGLSIGWLGLSWWLCVRCLEADSARSVNLWAAVVLGLGPLVRPDLAIMSAVMLLWLFVVQRTWARRGLVVLAAGLLPVAYQVFRMGYFGLLVPNTAVAKESGRVLWRRGMVYLLDFVDTYGLYLVGAVALCGLVAVLAVLRGSRRGTGLAAAGLVAALLYAVYVVRVGGDFMHARLLLPAAFLALTTVAVIPVTRRATTLVLSVATLAGVLSAVTAGTARVAYAGTLGPDGIADERGFWASEAEHPRPVRLADHARNNSVPYGQAVARLRASGARVVVTQGTVRSPDQPVTVLGPAKDRLLFLAGNAGFLGVSAGTETLVLDGYGLTDSIGAHLEAPPPRRPGHEKVVPLMWFWARYGGELGPETPPELTADDVAAARAALACGDAAKLLHATEDPMTWGRFWSNVAESPSLTEFRIPTDPQEAEAALC
jgi:arabinofuranosyltransferase